MTAFKFWRFIIAVAVLTTIVLVLMATADAQTVSAGCPKPIVHHKHVAALPVQSPAPCPNHLTAEEDIPEIAAIPNWAHWPVPQTTSAPRCAVAYSPPTDSSWLVEPSYPWEARLASRIAAAPEMDATSASGALTLLAGMLAVMRGKFK